MRVGVSALMLTLASCVSPPQPAEIDPLAEIGRGASAAPGQYKQVALGIIFTENTRRAIDVVQRNRAMAQSLAFLGGSEGAADLDPAYLTRALDELLKQRFKSVVALPEFAARQSAGVDAVMLLEVQVDLGRLALQTTRVSIKGIFVDSQQNPIDQVLGDGSAQLPLPAPTVVFKPATTDALRKFANALDGSTQLAGKLNATSMVAFQTGPVIKGTTASTIAAFDGNRLALVIGNGAYRQIAPLTNAASDARLIAQSLRSLGFDVTEVTDADQNAMKRAIQGFGAKLESFAGDGVGLFYYAGHGIQSGGRNYLIPVTARIDRETDLDIEGVSADWVLQQMEVAKSRVNIVILDACRNNPYGRGFRDINNGLARMDAPVGTLLAYSTAPGEVAADGDGRNSPYSQSLASAMTEPGVPVEDMFKKVRISVLGATAEKQTPWESSSLTGNFFFVPTSPQQ